MTTYHFRLDYRLEDAVEAHARWLRRRQLRDASIRFAILAGVCFLVVAVPRFGESEFGLASLARIAGLSVVIGLVGAALALAVARYANAHDIQRAFHENYGDFQFTDYHFDSEQLRIEDQNLPWTISWSELPGWIDDDRFIFIVRSGLIYYAIPKGRIDSATLAALKAQLAAASAGPS